MSRNPIVAHGIKLLAATVSASCLLACLAVEVDEELSVKIEHAELRKLASLPIQAHLCDIAGTGQVVESLPNSFRIVVDNYWYGNPGSNTLSIAVAANPPPATNAPILFMASTNAYLREEFVEPVGVLCRWSYLTNRVVNLSEEALYPPAVPLTLLADNFSWLHTSEDNGLVLIYASNLVHTARVNRNPQAFYELVRDGANVSTNVSQRIQQDSLALLRQWAFHESEEFAAMMWNDPLVSGPPRAALKFKYPDFE
jgi:hypothetical protein